MSKQQTVYLPLDSVAVSLGANDVARVLEEDGFTVVRTGSRGMHWLEPLLEVDRGGERVGFGPLTLENTEGILACLRGGNYDHPAYVGPIADIPFFARQDRQVFERCGVINPVDVTDYEAHGGLAGLRKALDMDPKDVCAEVFASGLRGRGGAGFPAGIKWHTVADAEADHKYIVVNADEGDSGTFADRMIMEGDPLLLIEGMAIAGIATGAAKGYIYLRSEYPIAAEVLQHAIAAARAFGITGSDVLGSGKSFNVELFMGAGAYICGEETSLLNSLEGKRGEVRAKPPIPALEGLFGKPTLVHNVISLCSVPKILEKGAQFYADLGMGKSTGTMPFQIAGNVKQGGLFEAPFGMTIRELVEELSGGTRTGRPIRAVQIGGPLGAYLPNEMLDLKLDYETLASHGAGVGHGGMVVFDDTVNLLAQARYAFEFCAEESCGKCTPCRIGSVRGVEAIDKLASGQDPEGQKELIADLCEVMVDGSLCAMGGMTPIPVESAMKHFPEDFNIHPAKS
ncbi:MAG: SLBB domain-containing protein [Kordiimonadaceae bacterium]|nr:SLBB domain-containing protein [Kordiimonadaceae bacterium]MBO6568651.1 SLBB domain-containing protein [Kordiimonadaceae bacterium]MBO6965373.1 SLBB domain-containing protein [Kordiimonadaceae bacterium]